jgi:hypothetical protein
MKIVKKTSLQQIEEDLQRLLILMAVLTIAKEDK